MDTQVIVERTRRWIAEIVIGLNLCPFARRVFEEGKIRYSVTEAQDERSLLKALTDEALLIAGTPIDEIETTLLIHPQAFGDFLDYNDFLDPAEQAIRDLGLGRVLQIASFHPQYQFAETEADAVENYTNRSPYPMLHLLREASIMRLGIDDDELYAIPERNMEALRSLGKEKLLEKLASTLG